MYITINYGEDYDVLFLPTDDVDINDLHKQFCDWLYDEKSTHTYRVCFEDGSIGYSYDANAFVEWLNENFFMDQDKAVLVEENTKNVDVNRPCINF